MAFITAFIVCLHPCHSPFCEAVLLLLQCYSAVLNNCTPSCYIILSCHSNGILSQLVTPYNILYLVCDFLKCFLSKVKICRRDSGLIIQSIYQERWKFGGGGGICVFNFHLVFFKQVKKDPWFEDGVARIFYTTSSTFKELKSNRKSLPRLSGPVVWDAGKAVHIFYHFSALFPEHPVLGYPRAGMWVRGSFITGT